MIEPALVQKLDAAIQQAVLCDTRGRAIGFFSPLPDRPKLEDLQLEPPLSVEATEELRQVRTGKPLGEILDRLGI